jgi:hypothetical protein
MRVTDAIAAVERIPRELKLANVALAVLLAKNPECTHAFVTIGFRERRCAKQRRKLGWFVRQGIDLILDLRKLLVNPGAGTMDVVSREKGRVPHSKGG